MPFNKWQMTFLPTFNSQFSLAIFCLPVLQRKAIHIPFKFQCLSLKPPRLQDFYSFSHFHLHLHVLSASFLHVLFAIYVNCQRETQATSLVSTEDIPAN